MIENYKGPIGFIGFKLGSRWNTTSAQIDLLYIEPTYWQRGLGSILLQACFINLRFWGYSEVFAEAHSHNSTRFFYEKNFAQKVKTIQTVLSNKLLPADVYYWNTTKTYHSLLLTFYSFINYHQERRFNDRGAVMLTQTKIESIHPQLFTKSLKEFKEFYKNKLGFQVDFEYGEPSFYAGLSKDGASFFVREIKENVINKDKAQDDGLLNAYFRTEGIENLFQDYINSNVEMHRELVEQPWGIREFVIRDIDGNLLCFGEAPV